MRLALGADHGGLGLKDHLVARLREAGHDVVDVGTNSSDSVDYPDFAGLVARKVADGEVERGILVCGTGIGMCISANKVAGIRAAVVSDTFSARMAMAHNNAKVLCLGERVTGMSLADACVDAWLDTAFEGGRHERRVGKIMALEQPS